MTVLQNKNTSSWRDVYLLALGELIVSLVTVGVFFLLGRLNWQVWSGCLVSSAVTVLNFFILTLSVTRAVDRVMAGYSGAKSEEETEAFVNSHVGEIQKSVKATYLLRQILLVAILVSVLLLKWANVIATAIPLLMYRPVLMAVQLLGNKNKKEKT